MASIQHTRKHQLQPCQPHWPWHGQSAWARRPRGHRRADERAQAVCLGVWFGSKRVQRMQKKIRSACQKTSLSLLWSDPLWSLLNVQSSFKLDSNSTRPKWTFGIIGCTGFSAPKSLWYMLCKAWWHSTLIDDSFTMIKYTIRLLPFEWWCEWLCGNQKKLVFTC